MNNIISCIKLDFYTIKKRQILFFIAFLIVLMPVGIVFSPEVSIGSILFAEFCVTGCFQVGEKSSYNKLHGVLPVKRYEIVIGRFLFLLVVVAFTIGISLIETIIISNFKTGDLTEMINTFEISYPLIISCFFAVTSFFAAIDFACSFSFEQSKAQFLSIIGVIAIVALINPIVTKIKWQDVFDSSTYYTGVFILIGVTLLIISCIISCFVYNKREL